MPKDLYPGFKRSTMKIMFLLILISLLMACGFLLVYLWAARTGQFDDSYTPSVRILFDDNEPHAPVTEDEKLTILP
jgi:cbb3-type cytochrome oxidase maturation protein